MPELSMIVPCYNEELNIFPLYERTKTLLDQNGIADFEFVFVNDGSRDATLEKLKALAERDARVKYVSFSRNFGKEAGMLAGLEHTKGELVAIMDADMQDPPELLIEMYREITTSDYDCIGARRVTRKGEPPIRSFFARTFYRLINKISQVQMVDGLRDFRLMRRHMVDAIIQLQEKNRFSKGIFAWVGFNTKYLPYENAPRNAGETKWSFWGLVKYSLEGIISFSTVPLVLVSFLGFFTCVIALLALIFFVVKKVVYGDPVAGYPSMISIILFLGGLQLLSLGVVGQYISKIYTEVKNRPMYVVKESNCEEE